MRISITKTRSILIVWACLVVVGSGPPFASAQHADDDFENQDDFSHTHVNVEEFDYCSDEVLPTLNELANSAKAPLTGASDRVFRGNLNSTITIVEYVDVNCTHCIAAHKTLKDLTKYNDDLLVVYKHLPILSIESRTAAENIEYIAKLDRDAALRYMDILFDNASELSDEFLNEALEYVGHQDLPVDSELLSRVDEILDRDLRDSRDLGIYGVPAFEISGVLLSGNRPRWYLQDLLDFVRVLQEQPKDVAEAVSVASQAICANWLSYVGDSREAAEKMYQIAIESQYVTTRTLRNYGIFLSKDYARLDEAEKQFSRALAVDPGDVVGLISYAEFVERELFDTEQVESLYKQAMAATSAGWVAHQYGVFLEGEKRYEEAVDLYQRAVIAAPESHEFMSNLGVILYNRFEDYEQAEVSLGGAARIRPDYARYLTNYALVLEQLERIDDADHYFKLALERDSSDAWIANLYARFLLEQTEDLDGAEAYFYTANQLEPANEEFAYALANFLLIERENAEAALPVYENLLFLASENSDYQFEFGFANEILGSIDEAYRAYTNAFRGQPSNAGERANHFANFISDNDLGEEQAETFHRVAIEIEPENVLLHHNLALFLFEQSQYIESAARFELALGLEKSDPIFDLLYGLALEMSGLQDQAGSVFRSTVDAEESTALAQVIFADYLEYRANAPERAEELYIKALESEPDNALVNQMYADFLLNNGGDIEEIEQFFLTAIRNEPGDGAYLSTYASFLSLFPSRQDEAREFFLSAISVEDVDADTYAAYGAYLFDVLGDKDGAARQFELAVAEDARESHVLARYAKYLYASGQLDDARVRWSDAMADPAIHDHTKLEVLYFKFAAEKSFRLEDLKQIANILCRGIRSPLDRHGPILAQASDVRHPELGLIFALSKVVTNANGMQTLERFPVFVEAFAASPTGESIAECRLPNSRTLPTLLVREEIVVW